MKRRIVCALLGLFAGATGFGQEAEPAEVPDASSADTADQVKIFVIPVRDQIAQPILYIIRNGVKDAISADADFVVLDMLTPGGELGVTLEIMEILDRFEGTTVTYINNEAISAGAFISAATDEIYFSPSGVIGAAAPVSATGEDINKTMQQKVVSYLRARIRSISEGHRYRGEVISAMVDADYELKIGDTVIKPKGELLSLTATEAMKEYGDPPVALLGAGIADDLTGLYEALAGSAAYEVTGFEMTWSIKLAQWLTAISPILMAAGGLLLFIEYKTPGFGIFGVTGILLILTVFFGHNVAGLSGHEPALFFLLGAGLVFIELLVLPGTLIFGVSGLLLMAGALLWGMADIWPKDGGGFELSPGIFARPILNLGLGFGLALLMGFMLARFLPKSVFWNRMVLASAVSGTSRQADTAVAAAPNVGDRAVVVSDLHPGGRIEFNGRHYEAHVEVGEVRSGAKVKIVRRSDFSYVVEPA